MKTIFVLIFLVSSIKLYESECIKNPKIFGATGDGSKCQVYGESNDGKLLWYQCTKIENKTIPVTEQLPSGAATELKSFLTRENITFIDFFTSIAKNKKVTGYGVRNADGVCFQFDGVYRIVNCVGPISNMDIYFFAKHRGPISVDTITSLEVIDRYAKMYTYKDVYTKQSVFMYSANIANLINVFGFNLKQDVTAMLLLGNDTNSLTVGMVTTDKTMIIYEMIYPGTPDDRDSITTVNKTIELDTVYSDILTECSLERPPKQAPKKKKGNETFVIMAIVVLCLIVLTIIIAICWLWKSRSASPLTFGRKKPKTKDNDESTFVSAPTGETASTSKKTLARNEKTLSISNQTPSINKQ